ncbi:leucine-rich repeat neuronal protein 4 [Protopterus annectens]|uniref:leucine-rich repeat neuronal protein 4 n=1 Tax=Protopterus annectens TaxID=7888 RepID=UPI001CF9CE2B|nr:leucine-rich repeat neuronal protein 4 [Protopterus annectens]
MPIFILSVVLMSWMVNTGDFLLHLRIVSQVESSLPAENISDQDLSHSADNRAFYNQTCEKFTRSVLLSLKLVNANLSVFPPCLPTSLTSLDLAKNNITAVNDSDVATLTKLRKLNLCYNNIKEIQWGAEVLPRLSVLDLSYNHLESVPVFYGMSNLTWLSLAGNPIKQICYSDLQVLSMLEHLNLSETALESYNKTEVELVMQSNESRPMYSLRILDISNTRLQSIYQMRCDLLPNLEFLCMRKMPNMRSVDSDLFQCMPRLKVLDFSGSHMLEFVNNQIFVNAHHLQYLSFEKCALKNFESWNASLSKIKVNLYGNPLNCSCNITWLLSNSSAVILERKEETTCERHTVNETMVSIPITQMLGDCEGHSDTSSAAPDSLTTMSFVKSMALTHSSIYSTSDKTGVTTLSTATTATYYTESTAQGMQEINKKTSTPNIKKPSIKISFLPHSDDYPDYEDEPVPNNGPCNYDACRHLQKPCSELQKIHNCLCPGINLENIVPDAPDLKRVSEITESSAEVEWCAPYSTVREYQIIYRSEGTETLYTIDGIYVTARQFTLRNLLPHTTYEVCLVASNKAGSSNNDTNAFSGKHCSRFKTKFQSIVLHIALAALSGVLFLAVIMLSILLYKQYRNTPVSNPYLISSVSIRNPMFDNLQKSYKVESHLEDIGVLI